MDQTSTLKYQTRLFINDCIEIITSAPCEHTIRDSIHFRYEWAPVSYTQLRITFKDGQFTDTVHSQYILDFHRKGRRTHITVYPAEQTPDSILEIPEAIIDQFLKDRIGAVRNVADA